MPRVTHVAKAQQRYETVPVIDPATGEQKRTPVMGSNGQQKTTSAKKGSRPIFMGVTKVDKTKPKPNLKCDFGGCEVGPVPGEIVPGQPYKHISPKSGPYGGTQRNRHEEHPSWNQWEYSSSLAARVAEIESHIDLSQDFDDVDAVQTHLDEIAEEVESLAGEKEEAASNMEEAFGGTEAYQTIADQAEALSNWAEEIKSTDIPEYPEPEEEDCDDCSGTGKVDCESPFHEEDHDEEETCAECGGVVDEVLEVDCQTCDGTGSFTPDEPTDSQIEDWNDEVEQMDLGSPEI